MFGGNLPEKLTGYQNNKKLNPFFAILFMLLFSPVFEFNFNIWRQGT